MESRQFSLLENLPPRMRILSSLKFCDFFFFKSLILYESLTGNSDSKNSKLGL